MARSISTDENSELISTGHTVRRNDTNHEPVVAGKRENGREREKNREHKSTKVTIKQGTQQNQHHNRIKQLINEINN